MDKTRQLQEQRVLEQELKSVNKKAKVYRQQQNSCVFFQSNREKEMEQCKRTMESLVKEYQDAERPQEDKDSCGGGGTG